MKKQTAINLICLAMVLSLLLTAIIRPILETEEALEAYTRFLESMMGLIENLAPGTPTW